MQLPTFIEHPLKKQILKECELHYWQLSKMIGKSTSYLSQMLNGIRPMPPELEQKLQTIVDEVHRDRQQQQVAAE
jgi:hypothetical protein